LYPGTHTQEAQNSIADLTIKLNEAQKTVLDLETTVTSQMRSMEDYSACLEKIKQMLSTYVYENQQATIGKCHMSKLSHPN